MAETRIPNDEYARIGRELIDTESTLARVRASQAAVCYLSSDNPRSANGRPVYGTCEKVPAKWQWAAPYDYAVTLYEPNIGHMTDAQRRILIHHELLHIRVEHKDGIERYLIEPHDVEDFAAIIDRYGTGWAE